MNKRARKNFTGPDRLGAWVTLVLLLMPIPVAANHAGKTHDGWLDQLTGFVIVQKGIAQANGENGTFDPYLGQLLLVRSLFGEDNNHSTYLAMNRAMDMLEAREGGISAKAADAIWDFCYQITPLALHDAKRHKEWWEKTVDWDKFFWEE